MVRGPGSGTSDSVRATVPEGTYIMPADSTAQIGARQLAGMGGAPRGFDPSAKDGAKNIPVRLSNGEYQMPPEQVHAVGAQALDEIRNATHRPVAQPPSQPIPVLTARGFAPPQQQQEPPLFFAGGGCVKRRGCADGGAVQARGFVNGGDTSQDPEKRNNSFGDAAAAAANPGTAQIQTGPAVPATGPAAPPPAAQASAPVQTPAPQPDAPAAAPQSQSNMSTSMGPSGKDMQAAYDDWRQKLNPPNVTPWTMQQAKLAEQNYDQKLARYQATQGTSADPDLVSPGQTLIGGGHDMGARGGPREAVARSPLGMPYPALSPAQIAIGLSFPKGTALAQSNTSASGAPASTTQQTTPDNPDYDFNKTVGLAPDTATKAGTPQPGQDNVISYDPKTHAYGGQNVTSDPVWSSSKSGGGNFSVLPGAGLRDGNPYGVGGSGSMYGDAGNADAAVNAMTARGFAPQGPSVTILGDDPAERGAQLQERRLRDAQIRMLSTPVTLPNGQRVFTASQTTAAGNHLDSDARNAIALQNIAASQQTAAANNDAAMQREAMQQWGANSRAAMQEGGANSRFAATNAIAQGQLDLSRQAQEPQIQEARQRAALLQKWNDPTTPPEQKSQIAEALRVMQGKTEPAQWKLQVTPTTKNADGSTSEGSVLQYNEATGEVKQWNGAKPVPSAKAIEFLKANPKTTAEFDSLYGAGAAKRALGG